jgi:hypothetical protein
VRSPPARNRVRYFISTAVSKTSRSNDKREEASSARNDKMTNSSYFVNCLESCEQLDKPEI